MDIEATNIEQDRDLPENNLSTQNHVDTVDINSSYDNKVSEVDNDLKQSVNDDIDLNIREDTTYDRLSDIESTDLVYVDDGNRNGLNDRNSDEINYSNFERLEDIKSSSTDSGNKKENNISSEKLRNSKIKEKMQEDTSIYDA